jgi:excisionase family DNA binding protein
MSDRDALLELMERTAASVSALGVLLRDQARLLRAEREAGEKLLTKKQACQEMNCGRTLLDSLIARGQIRTTKVGKRPRVPLSSIAAYIERRRTA